MSEGRNLNCVVKREKKKLLGSRRKNKCSETHVLVIRTFLWPDGGGGGGGLWLCGGGGGDGKKRVKK